MADEQTNQTGNQTPQAPEQTTPSANPAEPTTPEKTFTQAEVDALIKSRLSRAKAEPTTPDNTDSDRMTALENRLLCYEKQVKSESMVDVLALAKTMQDDKTTLPQAIDKVLEKYPIFSSQTQSKPTTTGTKTQGGGEKLDGVEQAFLKRNPGLKL